MKALLIVLCVIGALLGLFMGGCAVVVAGVGVASWMAEPIIMAAVVGGTAVAITIVNVAIIKAALHGTASGRGWAFLALAGVDFVGAFVATCLGDDAVAGAWIAVPLVIKGLLTIALVVRGARGGPPDVADDVDPPRP